MRMGMYGESEEPDCTPAANMLIRELGIERDQNKAGRKTFGQGK